MSVFSLTHTEVSFFLSCVFFSHTLKPTSIQSSAIQAMVSTMKNKVEEVYRMFDKELILVRTELQNKTAIPDLMPRFAGQACWVRGLTHRIQRPMEVSLLDYTVIFSFVSLLHDITYSTQCSPYWFWFH